MGKQLALCIAIPHTPEIIHVKKGTETLLICKIRFGSRLDNFVATFPERNALNESRAQFRKDIEVQTSCSLRGNITGVRNQGLLLRLSSSYARLSV